MPSKTPLRRELLVQFGFLFGGAVLVAGLGLLVLLPVLPPTQAVLFLVSLILAQLVIVFVFGSWLLKRTLVGPLESLAHDAQRIAGGDYRHRIRDADSLELEQVRESVNGMADRLLADQAVLAENIESLDHTNRELIHARDQVVHAARLASVGTLAAGIAHEVGNPLGAILSFVDVARNRAQKEGGDTEILGAIRGEAKRIDRIVRGLLDYARPRGGAAGPTPPREVVERVRTLLETQGKLDAVAHEWTLDDDTPDVVMESQQLEQVLVNLLLNAIDALEGRPEPRIHVSLSSDQGEVTRLPFRRADDPPGINYMHRRRVSKDDGGRGIDPVFTAERVALIEVSDNGPGIAEDDMERLFDPFFTTKEPGKGTGLGLSICARLVEGMGGHIEAGRSEVGGARFTIRLPGASALPAASEPSTPARASGDGP